MFERTLPPQVHVAVQTLLRRRLKAEENAAAVDRMAAKIASVMEAVSFERRAATAAQLYIALRGQAAQAKTSDITTVIKEHDSSEDDRDDSGLIRCPPQRERVLPVVSVDLDTQQEVYVHPQPRGKTSPGSIDEALHGAPDQFCSCVNDLAQSANHAIGQVCKLRCLYFHAVREHGPLTPNHVADIKILPADFAEGGLNAIQPLVWSVCEVLP